LRTPLATPATLTTNATGRPVLVHLAPDATLRSTAVSGGAGTDAQTEASAATATGVGRGPS
ncbi:hypothetical protein ADL22_11990, partial [Streptomyces sp. NRRL F-4489]|uniref:hypothetical protein n=1 Tax=Streptomyces sp. NRRL F-4489 TaxID=1609095 RepID=UPI0007476E2B